MKLFFVFVAILLSAINCYPKDRQDEVFRVYNGDVFAWYVVDSKTASLVLESSDRYPFTPKVIAGDPDGQFLAYAHRYIICTNCNFKRLISFIGPFSESYKCSECGKLFDERIGLYKWEKSTGKKTTPFRCLEDD